MDVRVVKGEGLKNPCWKTRGFKSHSMYSRVVNWQFWSAKKCVFSVLDEVHDKKNGPKAYHIIRCRLWPTEDHFFKPLNLGSKRNGRIRVSAVSDRCLLMAGRAGALVLAAWGRRLGVTERCSMITVVVTIFIAIKNPFCYKAYAARMRSASS